MSGFVMTNIGLTVDGVDLSKFVRAAQLVEFGEQRQQTGVGAVWHKFIGGPRGGQLQIEWKADYGRGGVYRTLRPLMNQAAEVRIWPRGGTPSADRPEHIFEVLIVQLPDLNASVGQLSTFQTTWPVTGEIISKPGPYWTGVMTVDRASFGGIGGFLYGFRRDGAQAERFGSISPFFIPKTSEGPTNFVPVYGVNNNVEVNRIHYFRVTGDPDDALEIQFGSHEDALGMRNDFLVMHTISGASLGSETILPLTPTPSAGRVWYRSSATSPVDDPGWEVGDRVRIEFWNGDPR